MKTTQITLTNNFHGTEVTIRPVDGRVSHRAGTRAWKALCGMKDCICGGQLGQRGPQHHNGHEVQVEPDFANGGDRVGNHSARIEVRDDLA